MDILESIGFIHYWGFSPAINFLDSLSPDLESINIFLSGTNDIRHILKTLADNCNNPLLKKPINIYIHEKEKESIARDILFLLIIHISSLNIREIMEFFLDLYGNALIREKSMRFLDLLISELTNLIDDEEKHSSGLKGILDLKELKYKEKDEIVNVFKSWSSKIPFKMEEFRDQRLRYHYKDRYDFRTNLIDWDFTMNIKESASIVNFTHYREWRQSGVAFESRFSSYMIPNRTMSSYLPAKKKLSKESCLVRGYWGDIVISPYITFGVDTDYEPEKTVLFKIMNTQHISHSIAVSEFNVSYYINMIQNAEKFRSPIDEELRKMQENAQKLNEKMEEIPELVEEETKKIENNKTNDNINDKFEFFKELLALKDCKIKIIPTFEDIEKIFEKKKYQGIFDVIVLGFIHSGYLKKPELAKISKKNVEIWMESTKFLVPIKQKEREELNLKLSELAKSMNLKERVMEKDYHKRFNFE